MARVTFSSAARDDLRIIALYIAEDSPRRALSFVRELEEKAFSLAEHPCRCPLVEEAGKDVRRLINGNYVLYYRFNGDAVRILRIINSNRDLSGISFD